jgi:hypothetical protein
MSGMNLFIQVYMLISLTHLGKGFACLTPAYTAGRQGKQGERQKKCRNKVIGSKLKAVG